MDTNCKELENDLKAQIKVEPQPTELLFIKEEHNAEYNNDNEEISVPDSINESFKFQDIPNNHGNIRIFDRPYGCRLCEKTYHKPYPNLYDHLRTKHRIRSNYIEYMLNVERKDRAKIENCQICESSLSDKCVGGHFKQLTKRKLVCSMCPYQCASGKMMLHHVYSKHLEIAPSTMSEAEYTCRLCIKPFSEKAFEQHMRKHEGVNKKYMCRLCDYTTYVKGYTPEHMKLKHNMEVSADFTETTTGNDTIVKNELVDIEVNNKRIKLDPDSDIKGESNEDNPSEALIRDEIEVKKEYVSDEDNSSKAAIPNITQGKLSPLFEKIEDNGVPCYRCTVCGKVLFEKYLMGKHILQHTDEYPLKCSLCHEKCRQKKSMVFHLRKKHNINVAIRDIDKDGSLKRKIEDDTNSDKKTSPSDRQPEDDGVIEENEKFTVVRRGKDKFYRCAICHKEVGIRYLFDVHYLDHTGELPHSCYVCDYKAKTKKVAWNHMRRKHKLCVKLKDMPDPRPHKDFKYEHIVYNAEACKLKGEERYTLIEEEGIKKLKCIICNRILSFSYFDCHYQMHTEQRKWSCPRCDFKAVTTKSWERHLKLGHDTS